MNVVEFVIFKWQLRRQATERLYPAHLSPQKGYLQIPVNPLTDQKNTVRRKRTSYSSETSDSSIFDNFSDEDFVQERTPPSTDDEAKPNEKASQNEYLPFYSSPSDDTIVGGAAGLALLPMAPLAQATDFQLAFQLHRMYNLVLECQESMWEVLTDRIRNRESELKTLGWEDDGSRQADDERDQERIARQKFDDFLERYQRYAECSHLCLQCH